MCDECPIYLLWGEIGCATSVSKTGVEQKSGVRPMSASVALERNRLCNLCLQNWLPGGICCATDISLTCGGEKSAVQRLSLKVSSRRNLVCDECLSYWPWREIGCATSVSKTGFKEKSGVRQCLFSLCYLCFFKWLQRGILVCVLCLSFALDWDRLCNLCL